MQRTDGRRVRRSPLLAVLLSLVVVGGPAAAHAATPSASGVALDNPIGIPDVRRIVPSAADRDGVTASLSIFVLLTVLSLAPAILVMATSFTRTVVVLSLLRQAIGTQQLPPSQVIMGLSLILTMLVMAPTWRTIQTSALTPYLDGKLNQRDAIDRAATPLRQFMIRQIENAHNEEHVYMFVEYARGATLPEGQAVQWADVSMVELVPAFVLSELKVAFVMGFRIYLPFLVIDMVISAILISMGMMMLPPVLISLPFKLMLFVLADGWRLVVGSLLGSFA